MEQQENVVEEKGSELKKVMQTKLGLGGNCQSATIATLLGLDIEDVPNFWDGTDLEAPANPNNGVIFNTNFNNFLNKHGYTSISLGVSEGDHTEWVTSISEALGDTKILVNGLSPRRFMHSVIWANGALWHDPHPDNTGVIPANITFVIPLFK